MSWHDGVTFSLTGSSDHGKYGPSTFSPVIGGVSEPHHSAGDTAYAPRLPVGLRPWTQG